MKRIIGLLIVTSLLATGCGSSEVPKQNKAAANKAATEEVLSTAEQNIVNNSNGETDYENLRKKANVAEAASIVGYDGKAIKKQLNKVIDENEKMNKQLQDLDL